MRPLFLRLRLLALALLAGAALVVICNAATDLVLGRTPMADGTFGSIDAPDVAVLHLIFTALPMVALALAGSRSKLLWGGGIILTACFCAFATWQIWRDSQTGFAGGANIGLGLIMLASPFFIILVLGAISAIRRQKPR